MQTIEAAKHGRLYDRRRICTIGVLLDRSRGTPERRQLGDAAGVPLAHIELLLLILGAYERGAVQIAETPHSLIGETDAEAVNQRRAVVDRHNVMISINS